MFCGYCDEEIQSDIVFESYIVAGEEVYAHQGACAEAFLSIMVAPCYRCAEYEWDSELTGLSVPYAEAVCRDCFTLHADSCRACGELYLIEERDTGTPVDLADAICSYACQEHYFDTVINNVENPTESDGRVIYNYGHRIAPNFTPPKDFTDSELYFGMEIEIAWGTNGTVAQLRELVNDCVPWTEGLFIFKEDSSVHGVELVTVPFHPDHAEDVLPFDLLQEGLDTDLFMPTHRSCGTHIHVNRTLFDPRTLWKWVKLHAEMHQALGLLGGRGEDNDYGSIMRTNRYWKTQTDYVTRMKLVKQTAAQKVYQYERSSGLNFQPDATIEVRYPEGICTPEGVKKNYQLVKATIEFAQLVTIEDAIKGALADAGFFFWYIENFQDRHPELFEYYRSKTEAPIPLPSITKEQA